MIPTTFLIPPTDIAERNVWFAGLTVQQQRLVTAQDVLLQLQLKQLKPSKGVYVHLPIPVRNDNCSTTGVNFQQLLEEEKPVCSVCAIGAMFVSKVRLGNDAFMNYGHVDSEAIYQLFGQKQMHRLENCFELWSLNLSEREFEHNFDKEGDLEAGPKMGHRMVAYQETLPKDAEERLKVLMQNIVDNQGKFVIPKLPA